MNLNKKKILMLSAFLVVSQLSFSATVKLFKNGKDAGLLKKNKLELKHNYTEGDKEAKENLEKYNKLIEEKKIKGRKQKEGFLYINSKNLDALLNTGMSIDFDKSKDEILVLKDKDIKIENGYIHINAEDKYNLDKFSNKKREVILENSKFQIDNNRLPIRYMKVNNQITKNFFYKLNKISEEQIKKDLKKEKELQTSGNYKFLKLRANQIDNSLFHLKNSEFSILGNFSAKGSDEKINNLHFRIKLDSDEKESKVLKVAPRGFLVTRNTDKLSDGKYDLNVAGEILINSDSNLSKFTEESAKEYFNKRYNKDEGTPLFLLGKNTKMKAKRLAIISEISDDRIAELNQITANDKEDRMVVFEKGSEVNLENFEAKRTNIKFEGGEVNIISSKPLINGEIRTGQLAFGTAQSQIMGSAKFNIKGNSFWREANPNPEGSGTGVNKNTFFTDLTFLPNSKLDVSFIRDAGRDQLISVVGTENLPDEIVKDGLYKLTFDKDTKTYLGYSKRYLKQEIADKTEWDREQLKKLTEGDPFAGYKKRISMMENRFKKMDGGKLTSEHAKQIDDMKKMIEKYKKKLPGTIAGYRKNIRSAEVINLTHASDADMIFNKDSNLYLYREDFKNEKLEKDGEVNPNNDKQGNLLEFTSNLTLDDAKINYRTNVKEELSDRLITKNKPILGKGATLKLENQGDTSLNGKEELILIKANKGTSSKTKFKLENDKFSLGGKDYKLFERLGKDGKEFYIATKDKESFDSLVGTKSLAVKDTEKTLTANDKNAFENSNGAAIAVKDGSLKFNNVKNAKINGKYAIYSNNGNISGNGIFDINGNIYHKGDKGFDLTLDKGSVLNSSVIDISGDTNSSKLHFKDGSKMYVNNYSNTNMIFDKGSEIHLYKKENSNKKLDLLNRGNKVIFTEPISFKETDIYFRTGIDDEVSDKLELAGNLSGTGAKLHLENSPKADMPSGAKKINLIVAKAPKNFNWELANKMEIGGYTYDMKLNKKENSDGKDVIYAEIGNASERKAELSSTAQGIVANTKSDYVTYNSINDSIFDSLYSNITSEKNDAIWAKYAHDSFETKEYKMKNQLNTILVGMSKDLNQEKTLTGGVFAGNYNNSKKINEISASGSLKGFVGGAYLSYRGYLGFGDFIATYGAGDSEYTVLDSNLNKVENKQNSKYLGAGIRFGKQFFLNNSENFYVEPSAKITYGRINGQNTTATNGLITNVDAIKSWTTGAYAKLGYKNNLSFGNLDSYAKVGVTQEILGKYKIGLNEKGREEINLDNNTMNYGVGVKCDIGNNSVSFDFDMKNNPSLKNYYKFSLGYQYKF